ncbi:hypothetical protein JK358_33035 [Nocardia sp. 2]|uniref:Uncharacterized protein n=1 Tax=Nocardia acididurans TaxID=2802282 RepID=A0ABS1MF17_9NOCA|nr:hypothetical protein [Nocardia acididurans]MBL1079242.1 hypothetical protein [Nocardia acididurans]
MSGSDSSASQVELIGPAAGVFTYTIAAVLVLTGPIFFIAGDSFWDALCPALVTFPIGVALAVHTYEWRRNAKRFKAVAVEATAEILTVVIRQGGENPDVAELKLRISGPGFDTFVADCETSSGVPHPRIGDRRHVMVDPSDNTFAIGYDHLFEPE